MAQERGSIGAPPAREPAVLTRAALARCRHPREWLALALAVVLVGLITVAIIALDLDLQDTLLIGMSAVWLAQIVATVLVVPRHLAGTVEITATQLPHLHPIVEELRARFGLPEARVFVASGSDMPGGAHGLGAPHTVLLPTRPVANLSADEFRFLLGREFGRIRLGQTWLTPLFGSQNDRLPDALEWLALPRELLFFWWYRLLELSADRAGALACGSLDTACAALVKLQAIELGSQLTLDGMSAQTATGGRSGWRAGGLLVRLAQRQPLLLHRLDALQRWASSGGLPRT